MLQQGHKKEKSSRSASGNVSHDHGHLAGALLDRRPAALVQNKQKAQAEESPQTMRMSALQAMANASPQVQRTAQLKEMVAQHAAKGPGMKNAEPVVSDEGNGVVQQVSMGSGSGSSAGVVQLGKLVNNKKKKSGKPPSKIKIKKKSPALYSSRTLRPRKKTSLSGGHPLDKYLRSVGIPDEKEHKVTTKEDGTFRGARLVGDSAKLGRNIGNKQPGDWAAHHIVPASVVKGLKISSWISNVDNSRNGIFQPSTSTQSISSNMPLHVVKGRDHPTYNKNCRTAIRTLLNKPNPTPKTKGTFFLIAEALRDLCEDGNHPNLDSIPLGDFEDALRQVWPKNI